MPAAPTTHFVELGQSILYRAAGLLVVRKQFLALPVIGSVLFSLLLRRFHSAIGQTA
ncbi:hypothetical protein [Dyella solisilvae]|nr:hypothetical protein [Dyella solisilvae]